MKSLALLFVLLTPISVAVCREPAKSKLEVMTVHSAGLEGTAFGDSAEQVTLFVDFDAYVVATTHERRQARQRVADRERVVCVISAVGQKRSKYG
jgi:hypothetical protein